MEVLTKDVEGITFRGTSDIGKLILEVPSRNPNVKVRESGIVDFAYNVSGWSI